MVPSVRSHGQAPRSLRFGGSYRSLENAQGPALSD